MWQQRFTNYNFFSPQNFFQIISNLLEEENREKWEDAQQVGLNIVNECFWGFGVEIALL